jgi:2'-5' RNA ligase
LADRCTKLFDAFRAPMSARERARRAAANLSQSQMHNLERWGYPYLFKDFRFHMTLTGRVPADRRDDVLAVVRSVFARMYGDRPIAIDRLALMRQDDERARFRVIREAALTSAA